MDGIFIEGAKNTPSINWNKEKASLDIIGKSFPENSKNFYDPVIDWLSEYQFAKGPLLEFNFSLDYISSSSVISLLEIIKKLGDLFSEGYNVKVIWSYDEGDDDIRTIGESYSRISDVPFEYFEQCED